MKFYLASRYSRHKELSGYAAILRGMGHEVTSRWIEGNHQISDEGLSSQAKESERTRFAVEDLCDLQSADATVSFTEEPRSSNSRGGRHVEFGVALARGQRMLVVGPRENVFHCLPGVVVFPDWQAFLIWASRLDDARDLPRTLETSDPRSVGQPKQTVQL